jgi:hypothetical protein
METTATYMTSSIEEMHATESKAGMERGSTTSRNSIMRGTMITMAPTMTNLTNSILLNEVTCQEVSRPIPET